MLHGVVHFWQRRVSWGPSHVCRFCACVKLLPSVKKCWRQGPHAAWVLQSPSFVPYIYACCSQGVGFPFECTEAAYAALDPVSVFLWHESLLHGK